MKANNVITLVGHIAKEPTFRKTSGGKDVAKLTVAVNRTRQEKYGDRPEADWLTVDLFDRAAVHEYLKAGKSVSIAGELHASRYEGQDGKKKEAVSISTSDLFLLPPGGKDEHSSVSLVGRLADDARTSYTPGSNVCVAEFTLCVEGYKKPDYIRCVIYGKQAEDNGRSLEKGQMISVHGSLRNDRYKRSDGSMAYQWKVLLDRLGILGKNKKPEESEAAQEQEAVVTQTESADTAGTGFVDLPDEFDEEYFGDEEW